MEILFLSLVSNVACRVVVCGAMVNPTECHIQLSAILFDFLAQYYFCFVVVTFLILKTKKRVGVRCRRDGIHATTDGSPPSYRTPDLRNERKSSPLSINYTRCDALFYHRSALRYSRKNTNLGTRPRSRRKDLSTTTKKVPPPPLLDVNTLDWERDSESLA